MSVDWHFFNDLRLRHKTKCPSEIAENHPLFHVGVDALGSSTGQGSTAVTLLDPLNIAFDGTDPLSQFAVESTDEPLKSDKDPISGLAQMEPWSFRRAAILNKYTTTERLSIVTSFLSGGETIKSQITIADKVKHRLEQLDSFEEGSVRTMDVSQQEYVQKIEILNHELVTAWNNDHRVNSLKIAIQCSKLLGDISVLRFYPSQFILITDLLDLFGRLVYERLKDKAGQLDANTPANNTIPESTKETCQNWFYKIASIRELIPRLYVEVAILKCYSFLDASEIESALLRLTGICRGIGDPLVAIYARCYICRVGLSLSTSYQYVLENINDILLIYHTSFNNGLKAELQRQRIDTHLYLSLYIPALNWIMQGLAVTAPCHVLEDVFKKCCEKSNNALLLHSLLSSFKSQFVADHAVEILNATLLNASSEDINKLQLMRLLGKVLAEKPLPVEERYIILDAVLKFITSLREPKDYMLNLEAWAEFVAKHFSLKQINFIMNDILSHMTPNREFEKHFPELQSVIKAIVANVKEFEGLMTMDNFLPVIDLFQREEVRLDICKSIMGVFKAKDSSQTISDPVLINNLMFLCRVLNDSVNSLTVVDERRQICALVSHFIRQVNYGKDLEAQLSFYAEARAAFLNLDDVISTLVTCVVHLMCRIRSYLRGGTHTKKTRAFARACAAFCFITIPSLQSLSSQMDLYYLAGGAALINGCLGQADACFEAAIQLIEEWPPMRLEVTADENSIGRLDAFLLSYIPRLLTVLVLTPDSPDKGMLHLPSLLLAKLEQASPKLENKSTLTQLYLMLLDFCDSLSQEVYAHQLPEVISNDRLYGHDSKFIRGLEELCNQIVENILEQLQLLAEIGQLRCQSTFALELFQRIVAKSDQRVDKQLILSANLWNLAMKNRTALVDIHWPNRIATDFQRRIMSYDEKLGGDQKMCHSLKKLLTRMQKKL